MAATDRADVEHVAVADLDATPHATVFEHSTPKVVRLSLKAGESVPAHDHPDSTVVIVVLSGEVVVTLDGQSQTLDGGELLRFDGRREVSPRAETDATALVFLVSSDE